MASIKTFNVSDSITTIIASIEASVSVFYKIHQHSRLTYFWCLLENHFHGWWREGLFISETENEFKTLHLSFFDDTHDNTAPAFSISIKTNDNVCVLTDCATSSLAIRFALLSIDMLAKDVIKTL
jgi:hypothetical protein